MLPLITLDLAELEKFRHGDPAVYKKVYELLKTPLYLFLFSIVRDRSSAEDLAADTFVRLWEKKATMENGGKIKNFLYQVGHNLAVDFLRSKTARSTTLAGDTAFEIADTRPDPLHAMIRAEITDQRTFWYALAVNEIMNDSHEYCKVFKLYHLYGKSTSQIADALNISPRTVLNHLNRARKKLAERITKKGLRSLPLVFIMASLFL